MRIPSFENVEEKIRFCICCRLKDGRHYAVPGAGHRRARLMFVGEAPGREEDLSCLPFVGAAGKYLDHLLGTIGLSREEIYITNIVKCRPPDNRNPLPDEMDTCASYLHYQLRAIAPTLVVTLGNFAFRRLTDSTLGITKAHGLFYEKGGTTFFASFHPAAVLYNPRLKSSMEEDFQRLRAHIEKSGEGRILL